MPASRRWRSAGQQCSSGSGQKQLKRRENALFLSFRSHVGPKWIEPIQTTNENDMLESRFSVAPMMDWKYGRENVSPATWLARLRRAM
jgi:hypothetical protein